MTTDVYGSTAPYTGYVQFGFSLTLAATPGTTDEVEAFSCVNTATT